MRGGADIQDQLDDADLERRPSSVRRAALELLFKSSMLAQSPKHIPCSDVQEIQEDEEVCFPSFRDSDCVSVMTEAPEQQEDC